MTKVNNQSLKVNIFLEFSATKSFEILDGIQILLTKSHLPKRMKDAIHIVDWKIRQLYPDYVFDPKKEVKTETAFKFIRDIISNTNNHASYIEASLQVGLFSRAFHLMKKIRLENKNTNCVINKSLIVDSRFYEPSSYILARSGKLSNIMAFVTEMDNSKILPSLPVIFSCLEAAGRKEIIDTNVVQKMMSYVEKHGLLIRNAILAAPISKDNYQFIMKAINTVDRGLNFTAEQRPEINKKGNLYDTPFNSTIGELDKYFDAQLEVEKICDTNFNLVSKGKKEDKLYDKLADLENDWRNELKTAFDRRINTLNSSERWRLYPFLMALPANTYVNVMIGVLYRCMNDKISEFTNVTNLFHIIGEILENHYRYQCMVKEKYFSRLKLVYKSFLTRFQDNPNNVDIRRLWDQAVSDNVELGTLKSKCIPWDHKLKLKLGRMVYEIMFENLNVTFRDKNGAETRTPVLYEELVEEAENTYTAVRIQSKVTKMFKATDILSLKLSALELPMLHPPVPINDNFSTGYFHMTNYATRLIRKSSEFELYDDDLQQTGNISEIYNALNVLSMCCWNIDGENLDLVTAIFKDKGNPKLKIPIRIEEIKPPEKLNDVSDYKNYSQYLKVLNEHKKEKKEMYSLWVTLLYKINVAQKFRDKKFWFPYSMDFRGRVYPCPPHLNHIGDDTTRGLMKFSVGKKLGPNGLDWLKIHLINICGQHKRASNAERLTAANKIVNEIIDSAVNPLNGRKWWQESEKPWQTLAACREITYALKFADEKGNGLPDEFISHLGVHQDGSCNGLQHYAALGCDTEGAKAVNLIKTDNPQDVYSDVLKYVHITIKSDAEKGVKEAEVLADLVTRKIIKQTVMTTVYGVTVIGAMAQVMKQLKEIETIPKKELAKCSIYLAKTIFSSIGEIFSSASKIQNWFVQLASSIATNRGANISWITPMNLLVTQPYYDTNFNMIFKADVRKNKSAFPPNFIHSLDSTHMMMTALKCWQQKVTFVSVHDCYWTHACDVDEMNRICREEFVELYKQPILENLSEYLYKTYGFLEKDGQMLTKAQKKFNTLLRTIPKKGSYNIEEVLNATYFFS